MTSSLLATTIAIGAIVVSTNSDNKLINATNEIHCLQLDSEHRFFEMEEGESYSSYNPDVANTLYTTEGNPISFWYENLKASSGWHYLNSGKGFYNMTPITRMTSIEFRVTPGAQFSLLWAVNGFNEWPHSRAITANDDGFYTFSFLSQTEILPSYIRIRHENQPFDVESIKIYYECSNDGKAYVKLNNMNPDYGTLNGSGYYNIGDLVTISATPNAGYQFDGWYTYPLKMNSYKIPGLHSFVVEATGFELFGYFSERNIYLTVVSENNSKGTVESSGSSFKLGAEAVVTATPQSGYQFSGWYNSNTDELVSTDNPYTFNMPNSDVYLTAKFEIIPVAHNLTVNDLNNVVQTLKMFGLTTEQIKSYVPLYDETLGSGTTTGSGSYFSDTNVTITATPNEGCTFAGWIDDSTTEYFSTENPLTLQMPSNDYTVYAVFKKL